MEMEKSAIKSSRPWQNQKEKEELTGPTTTGARNQTKASRPGKK